MNKFNIVFNIFKLFAFRVILPAWLCCSSSQGGSPLLSLHLSTSSLPLSTEDWSNPTLSLFSVKWLSSKAYFSWWILSLARSANNHIISHSRQHKRKYFKLQKTVRTKCIQQLSNLTPSSQASHWKQSHNANSQNYDRSQLEETTFTTFLNNKLRTECQPVNTTWLHSSTSS